MMHRESACFRFRSTFPGDTALSHFLLRVQTRVSSQVLPADGAAEEENALQRTDIDPDPVTRTPKHETRTTNPGTDMPARRDVYYMGFCQSLIFLHDRGTTIEGD
ncbi:hypothetical protein C8Q74DRAFT_273621 [Fomes fomentarius]|nr:hypothetical protein C8Q74DRAFT_273621 [Fomes fomentarius]